MKQKNKLTYKINIKSYHILFDPTDILLYFMFYWTLGFHADVFIKETTNKGKTSRIIESRNGDQNTLRYIR